MTTAYTQGMAGNDPVYRRTIPTLKHFCANNNEKDRILCSSNVTPRTLHEYYYRAFESSIVRGGTGSMMTAYNELSGVPACMNPDLQPLVKDKWGLEFIVTDGADFSQNVLAHRSHATHAEALAACLKNGNDVMTDADDMVAAAARDALDRGLLTEQTSTVLWETLCPAVSAWANSTATAAPTTPSRRRPTPCSTVRSTELPPWNRCACSTTTASCRCI